MLQSEELLRTKVCTKYLILKFIINRFNSHAIIESISNQAPNRPLPPPPLETQPPSKPLPPIPKGGSHDKDDDINDHTLVLRRVSIELNFYFELL